MPTIPSRPPLDPELFDFEPGHLWVMHCAVGPIPRTSAAGIENLLIKELRPWRLEIPDEIVGIPEGLRRWGGELLGADPTDLAIVPGTTSGLVTLAQSYRWEEGDEVVTPLGEFPANSWPWKVLSNRGVSLRQVPLWPGHKAGAEAFESSPPQPGVDPETRLLAALGPRTRILSVSWMRFQDGLLLDLERLAAGCRDRGVDLVVDGIQAAGTVPISLRDLPGISAWTAGGQKGLLAPQGLGLLWTSPEFRNRLRPAGGWLGIEDIFDFDLPMTDLDRAQTVDHTRIELGVPNIMLAKAMAASLEALEQADVEAIRIWVNHL